MHMRFERLAIACDILDGYVLNIPGIHWNIDSVFLCKDLSSLRFNPAVNISPCKSNDSYCRLNNIRGSMLPNN